MSTTHDRDNTATPDVRENPSHMPDRNRVFSPAPPLIPLTHGSGLKKLAAAAFLAGGLGLAIIGPGGAWRPQTRQHQMCRASPGPVLRRRLALAMVTSASRILCGLNKTWIRRASLKRPGRT